MDAREQVYEKVARHAAAVVLIVAPAEHPHGVERLFRSRAKEAIPIDRFRRGVGWYRVLPRTLRGVAIPEGLHHVEFADGSTFDQFLGFRVDDGTRHLTADLQDAAGFLLGVDNHRAFLDAANHRLLAIDVLARAHGFRCD